MTLAAGLLLGQRYPRLAAQADPIEARLNQMDLRQKVGQLFLFSLEGITFTPAMEQLIRQYHAGGWVIFDYNLSTPDALTRLTNAWQNAADLPLIIAADQEGGWVQRIRGEPFSDFPNAMALGAANDPALTQQIAQALAAEIAACGVNLNLAPVLDVNRQPRNPIINVRSFGSDPRRVAQQGSATIKGLQERGVIATGKHFPGHGRTTTDSHYTLPIVEGDSAQILGDLAPFEAALAAEIGAIMSAHVVYPTLDAANPATLSAPILTDLLRNQLGYQGVIISDALTMGAISAARSTITAALRDALLAGVDVLAYGAYPNGRPPTLAEQIAGVEAVIGLVETGALAETVITQAARRVLTLKARFNLLSWQPLDPLRVLERMDLQDHNDLLAQAAERSITLYKDLPLQIPLDPRQPLVLLYPETLPQAGAIFNRDLPDALSLAYPLSPQVGQVEGLISQIGERRVICLTLDAHRHAGQVNLISALPLDRSVILAAQSPYDLLYFPPLPTYLLCYGTSRHALEAARNVIFGQKLAWGQLPVSLEGV